MVYLESIRYSRRVGWRNVVSGQRVPMELTSLGRAYLATVTDARRRDLYRIFKRRRGAQWPQILAAIEEARHAIDASGFCAAAWQPEVVALASPLRDADARYVVNVSVSSTEPMEAAVRRLSGHLLGLLAELRSSVDVEASGGLV
jgi:DNA-binding IclR family transcriptional regulator